MEGYVLAGSKLTKAEIIESIYEKLGVNRKDIHNIVDEFFEEIKKGLKEDKVVELRGFGTFEIRTRKGRQRAQADSLAFAAVVCHQPPVSSRRIWLVV